MEQQEQKHILLTNIWLSSYTGSELNCLCLASALRKMGYNIEVTTFSLDKPIIDDFKSENFSVAVLPNENLSRTHYDLIWAHHSIVLDYILFKLNISADKIIFSSLSPFEPYEVIPPYVNNLTLCLANSEETKERLLLEGANPQLVSVFPNYVDDSWVLYKARESYPEYPHKIAIVSNHVAKELSEAAYLLKDSCVVDIFGLGHTFVKITPDILSVYDLVITIGKTVQFSMSISQPVFVYDIHGGPGYLNKDNLDRAAHFNFSGRGFSKMTADELIDEIFDKYKNNLQFLNILKQYVFKNCILETNIKKLLQQLETLPTLCCNNLREQYGYMFRSNAALLRLFLTNKDQNHLIYKLQEQINSLNQLVSEQHEQILSFNQHISWLGYKFFFRLKRFVKRIIKRIFLKNNNNPPTY